MNDLFADIGWYSLYKYEEQLCGDHVELADREDDTRILVLADGLGSGVKANILSTLTSKIISTMMADGMDIDDCVATIASTLPICEERNVAYSTFTIIKITGSERAEIIQYDNPHVIWLHNGVNTDYNESMRTIDGKDVYFSTVLLAPGDCLIATSDGALHASSTTALNMDWDRNAIADYMEALYHPDYTAKELVTLLLDKCSEMYGGCPADDTTACIVKIRQRTQVNLCFGPPEKKQDDERMMSIFFSKAGKHIVCGGTTSGVAARHLHKNAIVLPDTAGAGLPPMLRIEGVDLVTEGALTMSRVLSYAKSYISDNESYFEWSGKKNGAARIATMLFEEATDITFFVGRAVNEGNAEADESLSFKMKLQLVEELCDCLKKMGKHIKVSFF